MLLPNSPYRDDGFRVIAVFLALSFTLPTPALALRPKEVNEQTSGLEELKTTLKTDQQTLAGLEEWNRPLRLERAVKIPPGVNEDAVGALTIDAARGLSGEFKKALEANPIPLFGDPDSIDEYFRVQIPTETLAKQDAVIDVGEALHNAVEAIVARVNAQKGWNNGNVEIKAFRRERALVLELSDNGIGFKPEDLKDRAFRQPFTTKGEGIGNGLLQGYGLQVLAQRGGTLEVDSRRFDSRRAGRLTYSPSQQEEPFAFILTSRRNVGTTIRWHIPNAFTESSAGLEEFPADIRPAVEILMSPEQHSQESVKDALNQLRIVDRFPFNDKRIRPYYQLLKTAALNPRLPESVRGEATRLIGDSEYHEALELFEQLLGKSQPSQEAQPWNIRIVSLISIASLAFKDEGELDRAIKLLEWVVQHDPDEQIRQDSAIEDLSDMRQIAALAKQLWKQSSEVGDRQKALEMFRRFRAEQARYEWVPWEALRRETDPEQAIRLIGSLLPKLEEGLGQKADQMKIEAFRTLLGQVRDRFSALPPTSSVRGRLNASIRNTLRRLSSAGLEEWGEEAWNRLYQLHDPAHSGSRGSWKWVLGAHKTPVLAGRIQNFWQRLLESIPETDPSLKETVRLFHDRGIVPVPLLSGASLLYDRQLKEGVLLVGDERRFQLIVALVAKQGPSLWEEDDSSRWQFLAHQAIVGFVSDGELVAGLDPLMKTEILALPYNPPREGSRNRLFLESAERFVPVKRIVWLPPVNQGDVSDQALKGFILNQNILPATAPESFLEAILTLPRRPIQAPGMAAVEWYKQKAVPTLAAGLEESEQLINEIVGVYESIASGSQSFPDLDSHDLEMLRSLHGGPRRAVVSIIPYLETLLGLDLLTETWRDSSRRGELLKIILSLYGDEVVSHPEWKSQISSLVLETPEVEQFLKAVFRIHLPSFLEVTYSLGMESSGEEWVWEAVEDSLRQAPEAYRQALLKAFEAVRSSIVVITPQEHAQILGRILLTRVSELVQEMQGNPDPRVLFWRQRIDSAAWQNTEQVTELLQWMEKWNYPIPWEWFQEDLREFRESKLASLQRDPSGFAGPYSYPRYHRAQFHFASDVAALQILLERPEVRPSIQQLLEMPLRKGWASHIPDTNFGSDLFRPVLNENPYGNVLFSISMAANPDLLGAASFEAYKAEIHREKDRYYQEHEDETVPPAAGLEEGMRHAVDFLAQKNIREILPLMGDPGSVTNLKDSFSGAEEIQALASRGIEPLLFSGPVSVPAAHPNSSTLKLVVEPRYKAGMEERLRGIPGLEFVDNPAQARFVIGDRGFVERFRSLASQAVFLQVNPGTVGILTKDFMMLMTSQWDKLRPGEVLVVGMQVGSDQAVLFRYL